MTIPAVTTTSSLRPRDDQDDAPPPARPARSREPAAATRAKIDADLLAFVHNSKAKQAPKTSSAAPKPAPKPSNDRVLYVGMNDDSAKTEAAGLRGTGASVTAVLRRDGASVRLGDATFDLSEKGGCRAFSQVLAGKHGLSPAAADAVAKAIEACGASARDELARIAMALAPGERGVTIPSRIVFSGHSTGEDVHMGAESLNFQAARDLLRALPAASRQIEDVHFSGCFTMAQVYRVDEWRSLLPNLKTLWGYEGIAPGAPVGHLRVWDRATRGRASSDPSHGLAKVITWSAKDGIHTGVSLESLRTRQVDADADFGKLWGGDLGVGPWGLAKAPYETYRQLQYRPELPAQERAIMKAKADVLFRIRYYESVAAEFTKAHGPKVRAAFESLRMPVPDFERLSRKEAVAVLRQFEAKAGRTSPLPEAAAAAAPLLRGLRELDPAKVPDTWCH